jgi:hypothetical protein
MQTIICKGWEYEKECTWNLYERSPDGGNPFRLREGRDWLP